MARKSSAIQFLPIGTILLQRSAQDGRLCDALQTLCGTGDHMTEKEAEAYINGIFWIGSDLKPTAIKPEVKKYSNKLLDGIYFEYCPDCGGVKAARTTTEKGIVVIKDKKLVDAAIAHHELANDAFCSC